MIALFIPPSTWLMLSCMKGCTLLGFCLILAASPAFAGTAVEDEGPLGPCVESGRVDTAANPVGPCLGVEIATSFKKQEALDDFARVQKQYSDLLGSYQPLIVEDCDLHMGTDAAIFGQDRHRQPR